MRYYDISIDGMVGQVPCPDVLPERGQILTIRQPFGTLANLQYRVGDQLKLVARTYSAPHGRLSSLGNWIVRCPHQLSIWSNIEWMIAEGMVS
jgi:hypothetical protein